MDYVLQMYSFVISVQFVCRKTDNIDSRVTRLLDVCDSIPGRGKILLYRNARGQALGPVQPSVQWEPASLFPVVKRSGRETDNAPTYSVKVKNTMRYNSTHQNSSWPAV
jgi:hypothetical protein